MGELKDELNEELAPIVKFSEALLIKMEEMEELEYTAGMNPLKPIIKKLVAQEPNITKKEYHKKAKELAKKMFPKIIEQLNEMDIVIDGLNKIIEEKTAKITELRENIEDMDNELQEAKAEIDRM
jgi:flagellar biosynthesis chaperone FliJ